MLIQAKQNGESKENSNLLPSSPFFLEFLLLQSLLQEALAGRQQLPFATTANRNNNYEGKQQQSIAKRQSKLATANKNKIKPQLTNYYLLKISHKKKEEQEVRPTRTKFALSLLRAVCRVESVEKGRMEGVPSYFKDCCGANVTWHKKYVNPRDVSQV